MSVQLHKYMYCRVAPAALRAFCEFIIFGKYFGVCNVTLYNWINDHDMSACLVGRILRFTNSKIVEWVKVLGTAERVKWNERVERTSFLLVFGICREVFAKPKGTTSMCNQWLHKIAAHMDCLYSCRLANICSMSSR